MREMVSTTMKQYFILKRSTLFVVAEKKDSRSLFFFSLCRSYSDLPCTLKQHLPQTSSAGAIHTASQNPDVGAFSLKSYGKTCRVVFLRSIRTQMYQTKNSNYITISRTPATDPMFFRKLIFSWVFDIQDPQKHGAQGRGLPCLNPREILVGSFGLFSRFWNLEKRPSKILEAEPCSWQRMELPILEVSGYSRGWVVGLSLDSTSIINILLADALFV